jgi:hypothetical protein
MRLEKLPALRSAVLALLVLPTTAICGSVAAEQARQSPQPPVITEVKEYIAFYTQLPDGRIMGISEPSSERVISARCSKDNGMSWSEPETLFKLPEANGEWNLHNILLDHDGELHLFFTVSYKVGEGRDLYDEHYDAWDVRSTQGLCVG